MRIGMRVTFLSAAVVLGLALPVAVPAHAQMNIIAPNQTYKTQDEVDAAAKRDEEYKSTMHKLPDHKTSNDPWGTVRSNNTGTAQVEPKPKPPKKKKETTAQP
jgi:hypothetical protein